MKLNWALLRNVRNNWSVITDVINYFFSCLVLMNQSFKACSYDCSPTYFPSYKIFCIPTKKYGLILFKEQLEQAIYDTMASMYESGVFRFHGLSY